MLLTYSPYLLYNMKRTKASAIAEDLGISILGYGGRLLIL